jgi:hypothetical protein
MSETVFSIEPSLDKNMIINVPGWDKNLKILYSVEIHAGVSHLCWKIQGTEHIFRIGAAIIYEKHGLNFSDHFSLTLETFREDYKEWEKLQFPEDWMKRYQKIFQHLIK